jgi:hypothetical protein
MNKIINFTKNGFQFTYRPSYNVVGIEDDNYNICISGVESKTMANNAASFIVILALYFSEINTTYDDLIEVGIAIESKFDELNKLVNEGRITESEKNLIFSNYIKKIGYTL